MKTSSTKLFRSLGLATLLLLLVLGLAGGAWWASRPAASSPDVRWGAAHMVLSPATGQPMAPRAVELPDSWKPHGLPGTGMARYRLGFELNASGMADSMRQPWALRIDQLSTEHILRLNGRLLHSTMPRGHWLGEPRAHLIDIPEGMLKAGPNVLDIEVHYTLHGGLSAPALAPKAWLRTAYLAHEWVWVAVPLLLNIASAAIALFLVVLWWQRREERATGLFGLLFILASVRNCTYYISDDLGWPVGLSLWMSFCVHLCSATLLGWFAIQLSQRPWPAFSRLLWAAQVSLPLAMGITTVWSDAGAVTLRAWTTPILILLTLPSLWMLARLTGQLKRRALLGLTVGTAIVIAAGVHDFTTIRLLGWVTATYWMPWAFPLCLVGFSLLLIDRFASSFNDIEQTNANLEQKVAERTHELAAANAVKSHFLASASHDLRQPVAAIGLITDLLRERLTDPALRGLTERLTRAVVSMEHLLKGLLDLSRLDSGAVEVKFQRIPLQSLLESIASHEAENARHKGLHLRVRATSAYAWSDPTLLEQILRNLVSNAVRHTRQGGLLVGVRQRRTHLLIQVWDTGGGIAPHDVDRIFDEFVQLGNPAREGTQGLGLGLSIVKRAAHLLKHTVHVHSRLGRGSCFSVALLAAHRPDGLAMGLRPVEQPRLSLAGHHVLVIEDDANLLDALTRVLRSWGAEVSTGNRVEWVRRQVWRDVALVISDHRLPDGTGVDVIAWLRRADPALPALIITGDTSPQQIQRLHDSALPVLHKPFRAEELRAMIETIMAPSSDDSVKTR